MRQKLLTFSVSILALMTSSVMAQTIPPGDEPGQIQKRFQPSRVPQARTTVRKGLESTMAPSQAAQIKLVLKAIKIEGNTAFSDTALRDLYTELLGKRVTLKDVFAVAAKITARYGKAGYSLSRVIVPPQALEPKGAVITLRVLEGYVDKVVWPKGIKRYRDLFTDYAASITAERPIRAQTMERYLLLANDLPGLKLRSSLSASKTNPLASTMVVTLEEKPFDLQLTADNRGTKGSGPAQVSAIGTVNNLLGFHETLRFGYTTAGPDRGKLEPELHYIVFGYKQVLTSEGTAFDFSGNASWGEPGTAALRTIDYESRGLNLSWALSHPFIRTRSQNLTATIAFDFKNSKGFQLGAPSSRDRLRIVRGELAYDLADESGGVNQVIIGLSHGIDGLGSTKNGNLLASRSNGKVDFFKITASVSRTQNLPNNFQLYGGVSGQWTPDPLLSSQECGYGGSQFGRGFDPSIITGDRCFQGLVELRYNVNVGSTAWRQLVGYAQLYSFADYGKVWNLKAPLGTAKHDDAASGGIGLRFGKGWFNTDLQLTRTIHKPNSVAGTADWRAFIQLSAQF